LRSTVFIFTVFAVVWTSSSVNFTQFPFTSNGIVLYFFIEPVLSIVVLILQIVSLLYKSKFILLLLFNLFHSLVLAFAVLHFS
jgi:hypothetical protein